MTSQPTEETPATVGEALIRAYCDWHIAPSRTETLYVEGSGSRLLLLPSLHVTEVAAVTEVDTPTDTDGQAVVETWSWTPDGRMYRAGGWTQRQLYRIELTHGWPTWPAHLQHLADGIDGRSATAGPGQAYVQVGQVRIATGADGAPLGGTLTTGEQTMLAPYKLPTRP